jgi:hypothetical protein
MTPVRAPPPQPLLCNNMRWVIKLKNCRFLRAPSSLEPRLCVDVECPDPGPSRLHGLTRHHRSPPHPKEASENHAHAAHTQPVRSCANTQQPRRPCIGALPITTGARTPINTHISADLHISGYPVHDNDWLSIPLHRLLHPPMWQCAAHNAARCATHPCTCPLAVMGACICLYLIGRHAHFHLAMYRCPTLVPPHTCPRLQLHRFFALNVRPPPMGQ